MIEIVFDRNKGYIGRRRKATDKEQKEHGTNYVVEILEPINMARVEKIVPGFSDNDYDWEPLPNKDPRVQFIQLFDIIESGGEAEWFYSGFPEGYNVEEAYIENRHKVFGKIQNIFK